MAKMTKKEMFNKIAAVVEGNATIETAEERTMILDFINHEVELLEKKRSSGKMTKVQEENENIKTTILTALAGMENGVTITEIQTADSFLAGYANQKLSALMRQLVLEGKVEKTVDKKKSFFSIAQ